MTASSDVILQLMELAVVTSTMYKNTASSTKEQLRRDQVQTEVVQATVSLRNSTVQAVDQALIQKRAGAWAWAAQNRTGAAF